MSAGYSIDALRQDDLSAVARFSHDFHRDAPSPPAGDSQAIESRVRQLRWRIFDNPWYRPEFEAGQVLRDSAGAIVGVNVQFPVGFRLGDAALVGVCGAGFFVRPEARLQAFFMFRRFLAQPGADFHFATTCNASSEAIWRKLGGRPIPGTDREFLVPLRFGPLAEEAALRRHIPAPLPRLMRAAAAVASPLLRRRPRRPYVARVCDDLDFLARCADAGRPSDRPAWDRSTRALRWRFFENPAALATRAYRVDLPSGAAGWFVLQEKRRGLRGQIRALSLIDFVLPPATHEPARWWATIVAAAAAADLLAVDGGAPTDIPTSGVRARARLFPYHRSYVKLRGGGSVGELDARALTPAAGDAFD